MLEDSYSTKRYRRERKHLASPLALTGKSLNPLSNAWSKEIKMKLPWTTELYEENPKKRTTMVNHLWTDSSDKWKDERRAIRLDRKDSDCSTLKD
jgi:hypothetical protein